MIVIVRLLLNINNMILLMILFIIILTFFFLHMSILQVYGFVGSSVGPQCTIQMTGLVFPRAFHNFSNFSLFIGLGMVPGCHLVSMEFNNLFTKMAPSSVNQILEGVKPGKYMRLDQLFYSLDIIRSNGNSLNPLRHILNC